MNPSNNQPLMNAETFGRVKLQNHDEKYLANLANLDPRQRARYVDGEWSAQNDNAIFDLDQIDQLRVAPDRVPAFRKVAIGADPAVTSNKDSDLSGIIVAAMGVNGEAYVLKDYSGKYTPEQIARKLSDAFVAHEADIVVAETNNGGDWIESGMRQYNANLPVTQVRASRGKLTRAEPIALLYAQGKVHHVGTDLRELETQMYEFGMERGAAKSPDRMDALVWALWYLFDVSAEQKEPGRIKVRYSSAY